MGKKRHSQDPSYVTATEWAIEGGGAKNKDIQHLQRHSYTHCSLTLVPFTDPVCSPQGHIFDFVKIMPFLMKYKKNPVTGEKLLPKDLIRLHFTGPKDDHGHFKCPVLFKTFNEYSHIVAIKTTGNVYSYDAVKELNIKTKSFNDLLDNTPFTKEDIITLQDPNDTSDKNKSKLKVGDFWLVKNGIFDAQRDFDSKISDKINPNVISKKMLEMVEQEIQQQKQASSNDSHSNTVSTSNPNSIADGTKRQKVSSTTHHVYSSSLSAPGFTSTGLTPLTNNTPDLKSDVDQRQDFYFYFRRNIKKKSYVQIKTSVGDLNVELRSDLVPKTVDNFILLSQRGYYRNVTFHRIIRNFMIQGGDPKGTGTGGESAWGKPFEDEINNALSHTGKGILSMANSGKNTNGSQFFITFKSCTHLDGVHSIFGKVVGGLDVLTTMESTPTDSKDRPLTPIIILDVIVLVDPLREPLSDTSPSLSDEPINLEERWLSTAPLPTSTTPAGGMTIGKYISSVNSATGKSSDDRR